MTGRQAVSQVEKLQANRQAAGRQTSRQAGKQSQAGRQTFFYTRYLLAQQVERYVKKLYLFCFHIILNQFQRFILRYMRIRGQTVL